MNANILGGLPVAVACAGFAFAHPAQSQTAGPGPFARIPPLTTACYAGNDPFREKLGAAKQGVVADREKQAAINARIEKDYQSLDPMAKSQRMQQWMMENPQEAMNYVQASQAVGQQTQAIAPELAADEAKFSSERERFVKRYEAAMAQAQAPADARMAALNKRLEPNGCGFGDAECSIPVWAYAELDAVLRMRDAAYAAACPQWWGATGQVQGFLKRRRDWIVTKYLPAYAKGDEVRVRQFAIMNTPAASWRTTGPYDEAARYIDEVDKLYQLRLTQPWCTAKACDRL